jgi:hypothetical protein
MSGLGTAGPLPGPPENEAELQSTAAERVRLFTRANAYTGNATSMRSAAAAIRAALGGKR